jgi:hypothetical protein
MNGEFFSVSDGQHDDERNSSLSVRSQEVRYCLTQSVQNIKKSIIEHVVRNFMGPTDKIPEISLKENPYWPDSVNILLRDILESENNLESLIKELFSRIPLLSTVQWDNSVGNVTKSLRTSAANQKERKAVLEALSMKQLDRISWDYMRKAIEEGKIHRTFRVAESSLDRLPIPWKLLKGVQLPVRHGRIQVVLASPEAASKIAKEESENRMKIGPELEKEGFYQFEESLRLRAIQMLGASYAAMYYLLQWDPALYSFQATDALPTFRGGTTYNEENALYENLLIDQIRKQGIGIGGTFRKVENLEDIKVVTSELKVKGYPHPIKSSELSSDAILDFYSDLQEIEEDTAEKIRKVPNVPKFQDDICSHFYDVLLNNPNIEDMKGDIQGLKHFMHNIIVPVQLKIIEQIEYINDAYKKYKKS